MTDGIYLSNGRRPKSKKEIKETVASGGKVIIECTSMFGGYDGDVKYAPNGTYTFVGPVPYKKRKFYGTIVVKGDKITIK